MSSVTSTTTTTTTTSSGIIASTTTTTITTTKLYAHASRESSSALVQAGEDVKDTNSIAEDWGLIDREGGEARWVSTKGANGWTREADDSWTYVADGERFRERD